MSAFRFRELDSKALKKVPSGYETEVDVHAIISVSDVSIRESLKYHYDMQTKKLTLLGYTPTCNRIKIGYISNEASH